MAGVSQLLCGRLAVITGGGSGIGRAVSLTFAREGAKVVVSDIDEESAGETVKLITGSAGHLAKAVDVTSAESVNTLVSEIKAECGVPEILVNCAGITRDGFMVKMTEKNFDDVISVNLKGTFLMTQAISKLMITEKVVNGSIINISSLSGKMGNMGQCNYAASKAGVEGFTKTVARELARYNIRCNAVMPGFIDSPVIAKMPEDVIQFMIMQIPLGRKGNPNEVADVCTFLASTRSSYVTGSIIQVSGDDVCNAFDYITKMATQLELHVGIIISNVAEYRRFFGIWSRTCFPEVITLTTDLLAANKGATSAVSSTEGTSHDSSSSTQKQWEAGDMCMALWSQDSQYYEATVEDITEDGQCTVTFTAYGNTDVALLDELKPLEASHGSEYPDGTSKSKKQIIQAQREYKKKKAQKKAQRMKQIEEEREKEKVKWHSFNSKAFNKNKKGHVKKSIFASPDNIDGRVGVGTCGIGGRPMTEYHQQEKWRRPMAPPHRFE